jgi:hypothetical protein
VLDGALIAPQLDGTRRLEHCVRVDGNGSWTRRAEQRDSSSRDLAGGWMIARGWGDLGLGTVVTEDAKPDARFLNWRRNPTPTPHLAPATSVGSE